MPDQGCQNSSFEKFFHFWSGLAMKKTQLAFIWNLAIFRPFSVCHCKTKFSLKIFGFVYFLDGLHVIVTVTLCNYQLVLFWSCSNDLDFAVELADFVQVL